MTPQKTFILTGAIVAIGALGFLSFNSFSGRETASEDENLAAAVTADPEDARIVADPALVSVIEGLPENASITLEGSPVAQVWTTDAGQSAPAVLVSNLTDEAPFDAVDFYVTALASAGWIVEQPAQEEQMPGSENREAYTLISASFLKDDLRMWVSAEETPTTAEEEGVILNITVGAK